MKKIVLLFILIGASLALAQNSAFVINGSAETLSRINLETGQVQNHIVTLGAVPNQVICHSEMLYVVNSTSASLMVIDPSDYSIDMEILLPLNSNPWNVAVSGGFAYVTGLATSSVYAVDLTAGSVIDTYEVGLSPEGIVSQGDRLYVTNTGFNPIDFSYGQGSVSILETSSGTELARVNVSKNPQAVEVGPDGLINVICTGNYSSVFGMIYFIDPWEMMAVDSLATGGFPVKFAINSAGIGFISAGGWVNDGHVYSYDTLDRVLLRGDDNPILVGTGSYGIAIDSLDYIYSVGQIANSVSKFNSEGEIIDTYNVGSGPVSIAILDTRTSIDEIAEIPYKCSLNTPYPNPFNSSVVIPYESKTGNTITIEIFDIGGRLVKRLSSRSDHSIYNSVIWNGLDMRCQEVVTGIYFARLAGTNETEKMVLLR
ncbi:MAG: T9SS type A sorting domain-containing protein [candidate division Zixibacteria bacterium]|nr:T9SS type A sorting domain-containing protein [candidate division Zixibacteria bacterium]